MAAPMQLNTLLIWAISSVFFLKKWIQNRRKARQKLLKMRKKRRQLLLLQLKNQWQNFVYEEEMRRKRRFVMLRQVLKKPIRSHRFWIKTSTKSGELASKLMNGIWLEEDYISNLRISKQLFSKLCSDLQDFLSSEDTKFRMAIDTRIKVASSLYYLGENCSLRTVANLFGIGNETVRYYLHLFCKGLMKLYCPQYLSKPNVDRLKDYAEKFEERFKIPNCVGVIDGCHIPITRPADDKRTDYICKKQFYSIVLQGIVDSKGLFWNVNIGWPGAEQDSRVFQASSIYKHVIQGNFLPESELSINNIHIPYYILGDGAYPLLEWLMKPYTAKKLLSVEQQTYNSTISKSRVVAEQAFGRLKGRWQRLLKCSNCNVTNSKNIILACCILHNICESENVYFQKHLFVANDNRPSFLPIVNVHNRLPKLIREELKNYICTI